MITFDAFALLRQYGPKDRTGLRLLIAHSEAVARGALQIAHKSNGKNIDEIFLEQAAMVHDIGIAETDAPTIGCFGSEPYMAHGILGAALMRKLGFERHALVCERHIGMGLSCADIVSQQLPLPMRDFVPVSLEERIICYVDNFYSKGSGEPDVPRSMNSVRNKIAGYGKRSLETFDRWALEFGSVEF
ncbi:MAG: HDIG domain-containing protein [Deltaproteobacteria bacterium]|nr:HDIG domain-containing protein [Deltaproteobacteria bacterium]MBN2670620.1 HDIG domain-containing protein [Deltaproteobacteria bacterium]